MVYFFSLSTSNPPLALICLLSFIHPSFCPVQWHFPFRAAAWITAQAVRLGRELRSDSLWQFRGITGDPSGICVCCQNDYGLRGWWITNMTVINSRHITVDVIHHTADAGDASDIMKQAQRLRERFMSFKVERITSDALQFDMLGDIYTAYHVTGPKARCTSYRIFFFFGMADFLLLHQIKYSFKQDNLV